MVRSRAAALDAARALFLKDGYTGTTMEGIAAAAGLSKRTLYNIYGDKEALFRAMVENVVLFAENFARTLAADFADVEALDASAALHEIGRRLTKGILRPDVIALRRLLIAQGGTFPELAEEYYERAPGRVMVTLAAVFRRFVDAGKLRIEDPSGAAEQFAYLVAGAPLDRAVLVGSLPREGAGAERARDGVETFLARYRAEPRRQPPATRARRRGARAS